MARRNKITVVGAGNVGAIRKRNLNFGTEISGQWLARVRLTKELSSMSAYIFENFFADVVVPFSAQT